MELPQQLRRNRERCGMSQEDLAHAIYVSRQTVSSWENGKTYPDVQSLLLLSQTFDVSIDELVKGDVVAMKDLISKDAVVMERLAWASVILILIGTACFVALPSAWTDPSLVSPFSWGTVAGFAAFLACFALALACAVRIERIKKSHNLVSYKEISAFMEGEEASADDASLSRRRPLLSNALKVVCGAAVGFFVALAIAWIIGGLS